MAKTREYEVVILEILRKVVRVKADDPEEAERIVEEKVGMGEIKLDPMLDHYETCCEADWGNRD